MMNTKMTKADKFAMALEMAIANENTTLIEFFEHEIELLNKKSARPKKVNDADVANMAIIAEVLADADPMTCTEIIKADERLDMSTPKMSALLKRMIADGKVARTMNGKKAVFALV